MQIRSVDETMRFAPLHLVRVESVWWYNYLLLKIINKSKTLISIVYWCHFSWDSLLPPLTIQTSKWGQNMLLKSGNPEIIRKLCTWTWDQVWCFTRDCKPENTGLKEKILSMQVSIWPNISIAELHLQNGVLWWVSHQNLWSVSCISQKPLII